MANKRGLGRGLSALMGEDNISEDVTMAGESLIQVGLIDVCADQPRKHFDEEKLGELSSSIKQHGIIQPLILKKKGDRYMIIAGERRFRAARMAGLKEVPAIIKDFDDKEILEVSIIENIQREDLNPIEEAQAIDMLMNEYDFTQETVAERLGRSRPAIANTLRLLTLPDFAQEQVILGNISAGHARAMVTLRERPLIAAAIDEVKTKGLSVRQTEELVKRLSRPKKEYDPEKYNPFLHAEIELSTALETTVKIKGNENRGKIVIDYSNKEQLESLYTAFMSFKQD